MKKFIFIICTILLIASAGQAKPKFPVNLGGFTLGEDISKYSHLMDMETCREVTFNRYLGEGEVIAPQGFKTGLIAYGLCDQPNKIVRIKLKYENDSKKFFNKLLKQFKKQLGEPDEYKGDPFQTMIAWKWSFTNLNNERISLILQHNVLVEEEKKGTAVKMTLSTQIEKERACYMKRKPEKVSKPAPKESWDLFVPY